MAKDDITNYIRGIDASLNRIADALERLASIEVEDDTPARDVELEQANASNPTIAVNMGDGNTMYCAEYIRDTDTNELKLVPLPMKGWRCWEESNGQWCGEKTS